MIQTLALSLTGNIKTFSLEGILGYYLAKPPEQRLRSIKTRLLRALCSQVLKRSKERLYYFSRQPALEPDYPQWLFSSHLVGSYYFNLWSFLLLPHLNKKPVSTLSVISLVFEGQNYISCQAFTSPGPTRPVLPVSPHRSHAPAPSCSKAHHQTHSSLSIAFVYQVTTTRHNWLTSTK